MRFPHSPGTAKKAAAAARHGRSASLPRHPHPVLALLEDDIRALTSWSASTSSSDLTGICTGLAHVEAVLAALRELLELPEAAKALRSAAASDGILDSFLLLADAYGSFESALVDLRQQVAGLQAATRRGDGARLAASLRAQRRTEKELCRLAAAMHHDSPRLATSEDATDTEVIDTVAEATAATVAASEAIFLGSRNASRHARNGSPASPKKWLARLVFASEATKAAPETASMALARLEVLEGCIGELEGCGEKVFRRLVQTRVSLLNIHYPV